MVYVQNVLSSMSVSVQITFSGNHVNSRTAARRNSAQMKGIANMHMMKEVKKTFIVIVREVGTEKNARIPHYFVSIVLPMAKIN